MAHDNYDRDMLRAMQRIANSLEKIESYLRPVAYTNEQVDEAFAKLREIIELQKENDKCSELDRWLRGE